MSKKTHDDDDSASPSPPGSPFERERIHGDDHGGGGGHGGTEMGWLVSYADMMTLLFGLFVILFSLRTDKTKDADEVMKQVSQQYFSKPPTPERIPQSVPAENRVPELEKKIESQKIEFETVKNELTEQKLELEKQVKELKIKIHSMKPPPPISEQPKVVKTEPDPIKPIEEKVERLEQEKKEIEAKLRTQAELEERLNSMITENEQLKKELAESEKVAQTYLMIVLTWETEKHDLDLSIRTPNHKLYDFKHRKVAGDPGEFQIDSRFGPGIEMWKASNFKTGEYRVKASFYNSNGNSASGRAKISVVSNSETYYSEPFDMSMDKRSLEFVFKVDAKGKIHRAN